MPLLPAIAVLNMAKDVSKPEMWEEQNIFLFLYHFKPRAKSEIEDDLEWPVQVLVLDSAHLAGCLWG